ncbi:hypothetical protein VB712_02370 [Spirulina sp. CCNP1310]|uniref:hypothetical protein n=1 Tax=Spirulina sp. CCNP1310 TaxID=3110249 RepID=UPI002B2155D1|nr:hypothetical protein [Spirulina sp. CCNP1310]MEA5418051.1 hypothetical protein [Spirulina sp. CCNP1310]
MIMKEYDKDVFVQKLLVDFPFRVLSSNDRGLCDVDKDFLQDLCNRVAYVDFDYIPNWGINGLRANIAGLKNQNWYRSTQYFKDKASRRFCMINHQRLQSILQEAVQDIIQSEATIQGYSIYGSYLYGHDEEFDDIDILLIVQSASNLALDALRYRHDDLKNVFAKPFETFDTSKMIGLTIISQDTLTTNNQSPIVTEAALLDVATGISFGQCVSAPLLTPFVILKDAQKLIGWGGSNVLKAPKKTLNMLDQAIRMRKWMVDIYSEIAFKETALDRFLYPNLINCIDSKNHIIEICIEVQKLLDEDEKLLRNLVAQKLVGESCKQFI